MQYKYAIERSDYSDLASGRVFYSLPGHPAFPVRLASEVFQRCMKSRARIYNISAPCTLYDPCCGAGYHLSVLAYLHREHIREIVASDVDEKAAAVAEQNLELINSRGLEKRISEISKMIVQYNKDSHKEALTSAYVLKNRIAAFSSPLVTKIFRADARDRSKILSHIKPATVDVIFTDVPYGQHSHWRSLQSNSFTNPLVDLLDAMVDILSPASIVAIASDNKQKVSHPNFERIEQLQIGKRRIAILRPLLFHK